MTVKEITEYWLQKPILKKFTEIGNKYLEKEKSK